MTLQAQSDLFILVGLLCSLICVYLVCIIWMFLTVLEDDDDEGTDGAEQPVDNVMEGNDVYLHVSSVLF